MTNEKNPSQNHDLPRPAPGSFTGTWGDEIMNDDLTQKLEERLVARDLENELDEYEPYDRAIFIATDTGAVFDGDGEEWVQAERQFETIDASTGAIDELESELIATEEVTIKLTDNRNLSNFRNVGRMFESFEDSLSGGEIGDWDIVEGSGNVDTNEFFSGTQSLKLTGGATNRARIINDSVDIDLTKHRFAIAYHPEAGNGARLRLAATDSNGNSIRMRDNWPSHDPSEDIGFHYKNLGLEEKIQSEVDVTDIVELRLTVDGDFGEGDEVWLDSIKLTPVPSGPGRLLLDFDAGSQADAYNLYRPIIAEYGYAPSAGNSRWDRLGEEGYMTEVQARELVDDYGWKLRPHIRFRSMFEAGDWPYSEEDYIETIREPMEQLWNLGIRQGVRHFSFLGNDTTWESMEATRNYALTGREGSGGNDGFVIGMPINPLNVPGYSIDDGLDSQLEELIDMCAEYGGYFRIYGHLDDRLGESDLRNVLDYIKQHEGAGDLIVTNVVGVYEEWEAIAGTASPGTTVDDISGDEIEPSVVNETYYVRPGDNVKEVVDRAGEGSLVKIMPGLYEFDTTLSPHPDQTIRGYSRDSVVLRQTADSIAVNFNNNDAIGAVLSTVTVEAPNTTSDVIFSNRVETEVRNIRISGGTGGGADGIDFREDRAKIIGCRVDSVDDDGILSTGDDSIIDQNIVEGTIVIGGTNVEGDNVTWNS